jgi:phage-related protein
MEVVSYISIGALGALVLSKLIEVFQTWMSSPLIKQVLNTSIQIRQSLPPAVIEIGKHAIVLVQHILHALIQVLVGLPPILLETVKFMIIQIAQIVHLVVHLSAQAVILVKNVLHMIIYASKSIFVVFRSINNGFTYLWNFTDTVLNPLLDWMFSHPVPTTSWRVWVLSICFVLGISWIIRWILGKKKLKSN